MRNRGHDKKCWTCKEATEAKREELVCISVLCVKKRLAYSLHGQGFCTFETSLAIMALAASVSPSCSLKPEKNTNNIKKIEKSTFKKIPGSEL